MNDRFNKVFVLDVSRVRSETSTLHQEVWASEDKESPTYILISRVKFEEWETMIFRCDEHGNATDSAYANPMYDHRGDWEPMVVSVRKMIQESADELALIEATLERYYNKYEGDHQ